MKKLIFLLLFSVFLNAQTHRFIYEYHYKKDSTATEYQKDNMVLDVNPDEVKFYEYAYAENDSLNKIRDFKNTMWNDTPALKRKRNTFQNTNYQLQPEFFAINTVDKMEWKLSPETKKMGEFILQKATTNWGGRKWTAWFNSEIPISEGPYKFRGLPGLIFQIQDSKSFFIFNLVKSQKFSNTYDTSEFLESYAGQKAIVISEKIFRKKQMDFYNDPLNDFKESFDPSNGVTYSVMGVKITSKDQFKELTEKYQSMMRKENNPIERDKMILYPTK